MCAAPTAISTTTSTTATSTTATSTLPAPGTAGRIETVFIVLMENQDWSSIKNSPSAPYINGVLLPIGSHAEQYYNPPDIHPSEPNYLWLEAGTNFGILDNESPATNHVSSGNHLVTLLDRAGVSWRTYQEDIDGTACPVSDVGWYAARHDPFVFFDDVTGGDTASTAYCTAHVRPYSELQADLMTDSVARYNFITPNLCHDMHDSCSPLGDRVKDADTWLSNELPAILGSKAYTRDGALFLTWDEAATGDGPIGMIVLSPRAKGLGYRERDSLHAWLDAAYDGGDLRCDSTARGGCDGDGSP